jgi:hypothetical protein
MNSQQAVAHIPWSFVERLTIVYKEKVESLLISRNVFGVEECEKATPNIFIALNDIIKPALVQCGHIKEGVD